MSRQLPKALARDASLLGAGQVAVAVGTLIGLRLLTSVVSPSVYGQVTLLSGLGTLGWNFFAAPILQAALRYYPEAKRADGVSELRQMVGRALTIGVMATGLFLIVGGLLWTRNSPTELPFLAFVATAVLLAFEVSQHLETDLLNADGGQGLHAGWLALSAWTRPLCGAGLAWWLDGSATAVLFGFAIGMALAHLAFRSRTVRSGAIDLVDPDWAMSMRAGIRRFALPLIPLGALGWIGSLGDRYVLAAWTDVATVGLYAAIYGLAAQPILMVGGVLHKTFRPRVFGAVADNDPELERRIGRLYLTTVAGTSIATVVGIALTSNLLAHLFLGPAYWGASHLMPWIAAAFAFQNVRQVFEVSLYAHKKTRLIPVIHAIGAATAVASYLLLIPKLGAQGAALGTLISLASSCLAAAVLDRLVARSRGACAPHSEDPI